MRRRGERGDEPLHRLQVRIPESNMRDLEAEAERQERSVNWIVNRAVREYLDRRPDANASQGDA